MVYIVKASNIDIYLIKSDPDGLYTPVTCARYRITLLSFVYERLIIDGFPRLEEFYHKRQWFRDMESGL